VNFKLKEVEKDCHYRQDGGSKGNIGAAEVTAGEDQGGYAGDMEASTRDEARAVCTKFVERYKAKYPKAVEKIENDQASLLGLYDFSAENLQHIRTTNSSESTFATVCHRTSRTRNCVSRQTSSGLAFKLIVKTERNWQKYVVRKKSNYC
jgi:transposase-like protein